MLDLGSTGNLPNIIRGTILETIDHEDVVSENITVVHALLENDRSATNETIAGALHAKLKAQNVQMRTLNVENVVPLDSRVKQDAQTWFEAENLAEGRARISGVSFVVDVIMCRLLIIIRFLLAERPKSLLVTFQVPLRLPQQLRLWVSVLTRCAFPSFG